MSELRSVKGMNDILPDEIARYEFCGGGVLGDVCQRYAYRQVRTPIVEPTGLFVRSIGEVTDIVEKEMYTFVDKGDKSLTPASRRNSVERTCLFAASCAQPRTYY